MSGEPFMPLFLGDVLAETLGWTGEERALYVYLRALQWFGGPLSRDLQRLARTAQYDEVSFARLWATVQGKFVESDDGAGLINLRCEEHRSKVQRLSSLRATAGASGGKRTQAQRRDAKAVNPESARPENPCACDSDQPAAVGPTARASDQANGKAKREASQRARGAANGKHPIQSNPIQSELTENRIEPPLPPARSVRQRSGTQPAAPAVAGLDAAAWQRFESYRREIRRPIKPASVLAAQKKLAGFGPKQSAVVEQSVANSWQGLFDLKATSDANSSPSKTAAAEAWQRVLNHVRSGGYRSRSLGDAQIDEVIRQIGGYSSIGQSAERELPFIERRFVASYVAMVPS